jgi:eukaryotic-like serine/threonine-protein kinase
VRLALFAEMMKGKSWTPATLKEVGGTEGIGVTFLEETFSAATAPPEHRYHQKAARVVLKALLPETGSDIKGNMRSYAELLEASGYGSRPKDFDDLIHILDSEIRLITPTDPEGVDSERKEVPSSTGERYYQLTHDYLVHSLRDWLTRKQKETRKGRAELRLAERTATWNAEPEPRHLPASWEWANIRLFTRNKDWTDSQRKMMRTASRYHAVRGAIVALVLAVMTVTGLAIREQVIEQHKATQAAGLVQGVLNADTAQVPAIIGEMAAYRKWADTLLRQENEQAAANSRQKLHASLALLPVDSTQVDYLYGRFLEGAPHEVPVIRDALAPHKDDLLEKLWMVVEKPEKGKEAQRLRAASALASYDPESQRWGKVREQVANALVSVPAVYLATWMESLRPVRRQLQVPLARVYRDAKRRETERSLATDILADFAADQPQVLADLLMDADENQFAVIYAKFKEQSERGLPVLTSEIDRKLAPDAKDDDKEKLAKRQANGAVALLRMNQPARVWPLLKHSPDPRARSYLVHRLAPLGADAGEILKQLDSESDLTIRRALLLSLGEYGEKEFSPEARKALLPKLQDMYQTAADPGLHASAEWLLRQWQQQAWLKQVNNGWAKDKDQREKRLESIQQLVTKDKEKAPPQWYVNGQGQTMVVISGPVEFVMGSPLTEAQRSNDEFQHKSRIARSFALAATPVTKQQFLSFMPTFAHNEFRRYPAPSCPIGGVVWYEAAAYCNWLSKKEGIAEDQWCYEIKGKETKLKAGYLKLSGYRLPTEAEMEYATRAGAVTSRYFGDAEDLLPKYAWYFKNSQEKTSPVGSLKPNDLGLFDMHGNVFTWCQESYKRIPRTKNGDTIEDKEDALSIEATTSRVLRGGSFLNQVSFVRSAYRELNPPSFRSFNFGFRPARTLPLGSFTALPPTAGDGRK